MSRERAGVPSSRIGWNRLEAETKNPLQRLNELLDKPILDTNVRGGPLEPFKRFARLEPETASIVASVVVISFFAALGRVLVVLVGG